MVDLWRRGQDRAVQSVAPCTLVLDDGTVLIESAYILDWLDEQMGEARALIAGSGPERRKALYQIALSTGLGDKAVSLTYELLLHTEASEVWLRRCQSQIAAVLDGLEAERRQVASAWFFGTGMGHVDIALGASLRFVRDAHADVVDLKNWPALLAHSDACEAQAVFASHAQAFVPPARK
jgi:glutathione S-transferase